MSAPSHPFTLLIVALGGESGGVLTHRIVSAASSLGFPVQNTSIPGVAQRTGATTYYIECEILDVLHFVKQWMPRSQPWPSNPCSGEFHLTALRTPGTVRTMSASRRRPTSRFQPGMAAM